MDSSSYVSPAAVVEASMDCKTAMIAILLTMLCGAVAVCFYLRYMLGRVRGEIFVQRMHGVFHKVFDELGWRIWNERKGETLEQKRRRYMDSEMCEVSDDEYWRHIHYGPPVHESATEAENGEESPLSLSSTSSDDAGNEPGVENKNSAS